jgi:putative transposase
MPQGRKIIVSSKQQYAELTALRKEDARVAAVYRECQDAVLHRLDLAFAALFRRIKRGETPGYPRFKRAARWSQLEFPHGNRALKFDARQRRVTIPGIGAVRLRKGRTVPAFGRAWIVCKNLRWYACFECERAATPLPKTAKLVGIDRGVHVLAATSEGVLVDNRAFGERNRQRIARHQRVQGSARPTAGGTTYTRRRARSCATLRSSPWRR